MLKLMKVKMSKEDTLAAAFGRLCVETKRIGNITATVQKQPPSGGCVLKHLLLVAKICKDKQPPSGGCVLKPTM